MKEKNRLNPSHAVPITADPVRKEMALAITCGTLLAAGFIISYTNKTGIYLPIVFYIGAYLTGGFYTTKQALIGLSKRHFEIDFLMLVAALGAAALGEWAEGALLLFLFSLGHALEHYAMAKAKRSIAALSGLAPMTALVKYGGMIREVAIDTLRVGDIVVVRPNSKIAADGVIISGFSSINQAPITGESIPVDKVSIPATEVIKKGVEKVSNENKVFAGSINGSGNLEVYVTRIAADSTISRLIKIVNEAQAQKSPTQHLTNRIERYYVPAVLVLVTLLLFAFLIVDEPFSASFYRAMAVLVGASPCALAISTPSAVLSGVARAAWKGVLVKGGKPLEDLGEIRAIAFDKTGTLTEGKPRLTGVYTFNNTTEEDVLETAVAVEQLSDHPLAAAIVRDGLIRLKKDVAPATNIISVEGRGVKANYKEETVWIGNKALFTTNNITVPQHIVDIVTELELKGNTTMLIMRGANFIGVISLMDIARREAKTTIAELRRQGLRKIVMLTGDNQNVATAIGNELAMDDVLGGLLPQQKLAFIEKLKSTEQKIAMVGDGVNDAPAMAISTVGIAMGAAGSDVALETADVALMANNLGNLPFAIGLGRKARQIIRQNVTISLGMVVLLIPLTISGVIKMGPAVIGHEGSTILVVFNALRLLMYDRPSSIR